MKFDVKVSLLVTDAMFSFFIYLLKVTSTRPRELFQELSFDLGPGDFDVISSALIALFAFIFATIADNLTGKYFIATTGLIFSTAAFLTHILTHAFAYDIPWSKYAILLYTATSLVRNLLILEDFSYHKEFRMLIFTLFYLRILVRIVPIEESMNHIYTVIGLCFNIIYYFMFTCFLKSLIRLQPYYLGITFHCLHCYIIAAARPLQPIEEDTTKGTLVIRNPRNKTKIEKLILTLVPTIQEQIIIKDKNFVVTDSHWLVRSRPKCTEYVIFQSILFLNILPFVFSSITFANLSNFVMMAAAEQEKLTTKSDLEVLDKINVYNFFIFFQTISYPMVEFFFIPLFSKKMSREIYYFLIGYFILIVSCVCALATLFYIKLDVVYVPKPFTSQLRLFNANNESIFLKRDAKFIRVPPYNFKMIKDIEKQQLQMEVILPRNSCLCDFDLFPRYTTSYVASNGLFKNTKNDPSLFEIRDNDYHAVFYKVTIVSTKNNYVVLSSPNFEMSIPIWKNSSKKYFKIKPGLYTISFRKNNKTTIRKNRNVTLKEETLYVMFVYKNAKGHIDGKMMHLEGPVTITFFYLLPQLLLLSLAHGFAHVSFFKFIVDYAPIKLRCTTLAIFVVGTLLLVSFQNTEFLLRIAHRNMVKTMIGNIIIHTVILMLATIYFTRFHY